MCIEKGTCPTSGVMVSGHTLAQDSVSENANASMDISEIKVPEIHTKTCKKQYKSEGSIKLVEIMIENLIRSIVSLEKLVPQIMLEMKERLRTV